MSAALCGLVACLALALRAAGETGESRQALIPTIDGEWWTIARNPDLGELTGPKQQPVDFAIWQAADGTWQLWSCIRHTLCGGNTRLFYRWEGQALTDRDWRPMGIAMQADPQFGESPGGLQAPHVVRVGDLFYMLYGGWSKICLATSTDGKTFRRWRNAEGKSIVFQSPDEPGARDPMAILVGDLWHCYYTAHPDGRGAVYCRTSRDLKAWSGSKIVAFGGRAGTNAWSAECPHVVFRHGYYYLFRTQRYSPNPQTSVYRSKDPMYFGINDDSLFVCTLPVAAPEIVRYNGQDYIAALRPKLDGIRVAKLNWVARKL